MGTKWALALFLSSDDSFYISLRQVNTMSIITFSIVGSVPAAIKALGLEDQIDWDYSRNGDFILPVPIYMVEDWLETVHSVPHKGLRVNGKKVR